ncbi:MAG TPA: DoxX family protein [Thermoleophilaceae bacterium]|nr:DoxX family protein [Thermoleophilaceae bacterium]
MDTIVWIAQGLLAVALLAAGATKLAKDKGQLAASGMAWTEDFRENQIKGIGALEILAAIGLVMPALLDVAPVLVGVAAVGVVLLMLGAAATHMRRNEPQMVVINLVIAAMRSSSRSSLRAGVVPAARRSIDEPRLLAPRGIQLS